jgi:hypothetical protein
MVRTEPVHPVFGPFRLDQLNWLSRRPEYAGLSQPLAREKAEPLHRGVLRLNVWNSWLLSHAGTVQSSWGTKSSTTASRRTNEVKYKGPLAQWQGAAIRKRKHRIIGKR